MKKTFLMCLLSVLVLSGCKENYQINGTVIGSLDGETVYLSKIENMQPGTAIDSTVIINGAFTLKGHVDTVDVYYISASGIQGGMVLFLENMPIDITYDIDNPQNNEAVGSPLNNSYTSYVKEDRDYRMKRQDVITRAQEANRAGELTPELEEQLDTEFGNLMEAYKAVQVKFINDNPNSLVSAFILRSLAGNLSIEEIETLLSNFSDNAVSSSYYITSVKNDLEQMKKTAVNQRFTDIKALTPDDKPIALSDYAGKGKYVLIDFWASWCGPCRAENPNIVALYDKYKDQGFEIVGVSLDRDKAAWIKGIADDNITWPQMSDLKYWGSEAAALYNIRSIPATVLLDKEGIIIEKNLRGQELEDKIAELIDK